MRRLASVFSIAICLLICGAGCLPTAVDQAATQVQRIVTGRAIDRPIHITVDQMDLCRIDESQPVPLASFADAMQERSRQLKQADFQPAQLTIRISVDDAAPYSSFAQVVEACRESGFFQFEVAVGELAFPFELSPWDPKTPYDELQLPPLQVRLQASEEGELARLSLNDRQLADVAALRLELMAVIGDERGPGSIQEICEVEFVCDDNLRFSDLAAAYVAVSHYEAEDGSRVALVEKIWPVVGLGSRELVEVEVFEQLQVLPPEPISVETLEADTGLPQRQDETAKALSAQSKPSFVFEDPRLDTLIGGGETTEAASDDSPTDASADGEQDGTAHIVPDPAVDAALHWLVNHQAADGSWNFDHRAAGCRCDGEGSARTATNGATALALLPFLAVGQTHQRGRHQRNVLRGVAYLVRNAKRQGNTASFLESGGTMYSHGLATMALCETYRQSGDAQLKPICQAALDFIADAQDPVGGGWRYAPRQPGDTSVTGWQVAAVRSGQVAGLDVAEKTLSEASRFLDAMQSDGGAGYGYTTPGLNPGTSAIGLQTRMHLGWQRDHEAWQRGVDKLAASGPSAVNLYFNFYATQALARRGGEPWSTWHESIRKLLLHSQANAGHAAGSWHFTGNFATERGGRLYNTSFAALILAAHHRNLAIFQSDESEQPKSQGSK